MNNCLCRQPVWLCRSPLHHLYSEKERRKTNLSKTVWDHTGRHAGSDRYEASVAAQGLLWRPTQPVRHTGNLQENYFSTLAATTRDILMWEDLWRRETSSGFCASYLLNVHLMVLKSDVFLGWTVFRQRSYFLFFFFSPSILLEVQCSRLEVFECSMPSLCFTAFAVYLNSSCVLERSMYRREIK